MTEAAPPKPSPAAPPDKAVPDSTEAREARLAAALRANLRRRKAGPKSAE